MPWPKLWGTKDEPAEPKSFQTRAAETVQSASETVTTAVSSATERARGSDATSLAAFTQPQTIVATVVLTAASLGVFKFYRSYLRRIPQAANINPGFLRRRSLVGKVTSVGDGDNFRIYHTPGGRLAGWGWLPGRGVPVDKKALKDQTVRAGPLQTIPIN